jgi:hypothetical protein
VGGFRLPGAIVFGIDFSVHGALLLSRERLWPTYLASADREKKISFRKIAALDGAVDLASRIRELTECRFQRH